MINKNIAVVLAGGVGTRMGYDLPKQFLKVAGLTILEHTIYAFENHELIDEIAVIVHPSYLHLVEEQVLKNKWVKVKRILRGGDQRADSSLAAIKAYENEGEVNLIFHDAVRPMLSQRVVTDNINALKKYDAVDTAVPSADTIIQLENNLELIQSIPDRTYLWKGQTPQSFKLSCIKKAYEKAMLDPHFKATDDCGVVKKYLLEVDIYVVRGEEQNIKLTYKEDAYLLDKLFQLKSSEISASFNAELLKDKVVVVFGGSEGIGGAIVNLCQINNIKVYPFSRKLNQTDVCEEQQIRDALKKVADLEGKIDYVVNTVGLLIKQPLVNLSNLQVNQLLDVNLKGVIYVAREAYPYLQKTKGQLLNFTSSSYTRGRAFYSLYSATKAAIVNFVQAISEEWRTDEIRINCINPERTKTPMRTQNFGIEPDDSLLQAEEVAGVALNVLTSAMNGQVVDVKVKQENNP